MIAIGVLHGAVTDPIIAGRMLGGLLLVCGVLGCALGVAAFATDAGSRLVRVPRIVMALAIALLIATSVVIAQEEDPGVVVYDACQLAEGTIWWYLWGCYLRAMLLRVFLLFFL